MVISWYGEGCYKIQEGDFVILTDPDISQSGLTAPRLKANLVLKTLTSFPGEDMPGDSFLIAGAGEYDVSGISVIGLPLSNESGEKFLKTIYSVKAFGLTLCFLGHISEAPEPAIFERLTNIDILFFPGGGDPFLDQKGAVKIIRDLEPKMAIPGFYKIPGLKRRAGDLKEFLELFNHGKVEPQEKIMVKKKELGEIKGTQIAVLKV